jgi:hypothetical protein
VSLSISVSFYKCLFLLSLFLAFFVVSRNTQQTRRSTTEIGKHRISGFGHSTCCGESTCCGNSLSWSQSVLVTVFSGDTLSWWQSVLATVCPGDSLFWSLIRWHNLSLLAKPFYVIFVCDWWMLLSVSIYLLARLSQFASKLVVLFGRFISISTLSSK